MTCYVQHKFYCQPGSHGGFSETNIYSTGNQKNKQTKKYPRIVNIQLLRNYLHIDLRHHKLIINKLLRNYLHINL